MHNYSDEPYVDLGTYATMLPSAWTEVWSCSWPSRASILAPEGRSGQILTFFEILGGAGDINNWTSMQKYCDGP